MVLELANAGYYYACIADNVKEAAKGNKVISGCAVSQDAGGASMDVDVAVGVIAIEGIKINVSADTLTLNAADGSNPRWDLISVGANATLDYTAGTPAANPVPPDLAADHIALAIIDVQANDTAISDGEITDARIIDTEFEKMERHTNTLPTFTAVQGNDLSEATVAANTYKNIIIATAVISETQQPGNSRIHQITFHKNGGSETVVSESRVNIGAIAGATQWVDTTTLIGIVTIADTALWESDAELIVTVVSSEAAVDILQFNVTGF